MVPAASNPPIAGTDASTGPLGLERAFRVSLLATLTIAFLTIAVTGRPGIVVASLCGAALLTRLVALAAGRDWRLSTAAANFLAICVVIFYVVEIYYLAPAVPLLDRLLTGTAQLVLLVTAIKALSARSDRDYLYLAILSFGMMLSAAVLTVDAVYLAGFGLYLIFAVAALLSYEVYRPARAAAGAAPHAISPSPPGKSRLGLVGFALAKAAVAIVLGLVPLAAVLFFLIPRYHRGFWSGAGLAGEKVTGFSDSIDLGDTGKILDSNQVVMRVTVEGDPLAFTGRKLRGVTLDDFDGRRWFTGRRRAFVLPSEGFQRFLLPAFPDDGEVSSRAPEPTSPKSVGNRKVRPLRYRVLLEPISSDVLFTVSRAREIWAPLRYLVFDSTGVAHSPQHVGAPFAYEAVSDPVLPAPARLPREGGESAAPAVRASLALPRLDPRIGALARRITANCSNKYDCALAVENYLRTRYNYTLDLPAVNEKDPLASFLFATRRGNCEYFASAMAVMLRSLGIPARLVNGFEAGSYNPVGRDFVVRARDAHSWVEAHFEGAGWLPFDPTPGGPSSATTSAWLSDYLDAAELFWTEWVVNYDFRHQARLAASLEAGSRSLDRRFQECRRRVEGFSLSGLGSARKRFGAHPLNPLALLLILLALVVLAVRHPAWLEELRAAFAWKLAVRKRLLPRRAASLAYHRFLRSLERYGVEKAPGLTPMEFAAALPGAGLRDAATAFTRLYEAARFGRERVTLERLEDLLEQALTSADSALTRGQRTDFRKRKPATV